MRKLQLSIVPLLFGLALGATRAPATQGQYALLHSLLDPSTNAQAGAKQGWSVAVDEDIAVAGAPYDDVGGTASGVVKVYDATTGALLHTLTNPNPAPESLFGWAVAISGKRVVVGAQDGTGSADAGSAYVFDLGTATPTVPVATLNNPSPATSDLFGNAVAISGTWVVVGAPYDDKGATDAGSAYVYDLASDIPAVPVARLNSPNPADAEHFGVAVSICGDRVVVGAPGSAYVYDLASATPAAPVTTLRNPSPPAAWNFWTESFGSSVAISDMRVLVGAPNNYAWAGSAYVYDLANVTPAVPVTTLTNPSPVVSFVFGASVMISGTRAVVGAPVDTQEGESGHVYVYDVATGTPTEPLFALTNPSPTADDTSYVSFGASVAISDGRVVVGSPLDDTLAPDAGSAYVYELTSATPIVPTTALNAGSPAANDWFGSSVAISGSRVALGVPQDDTGALDAGIVYIHDLASATPAVAMLTLTNPQPVRYGNFGFSVAISTTRLVVGTIYDGNGPTYAGTAYVYDLAGATPTVPIAKLNNPKPREADYFGESVAISGARVVVGVPFDNIGPYNAGRAYLYDLAGATPTVPVLTLTNPIPAAEDYFGHDVAIYGTRLIVGAFGNDTGATNAGIAYVYDLASTTPVMPVLTLTNPSPANDEWFGSAVAISDSRVVIGAYGDRTGGFYAGRAYVYDLASAMPTAPVLILAKPGPAANVAFGNAVAISGTRVIVGAVGDDASGSAYLYDLGSATPTTPLARLTSPSPAKQDEFGTSVAIDGTTVVAGAPFVDGLTSDRGAAYIFGLQPALNIVFAAPGMVTLSWTPTISSAFALQYTDSLAPPNWINVQSGTSNPVSLRATNASRFYRLIQW